MRKLGMVFGIIVYFLFVGVGSMPFAFAVQGNLSLSNKEIIERLAKLQEGQKGLNRRMGDVNKRIDDVNKRIDDVNKRIDDVKDDLGKRIDDVNKGVDDVRDDLSKKIDDVQDELRGDIANLRDELRGDIANLRDIVYIVLGGIIALIGFVISSNKQDEGA